MEGSNLENNNINYYIHKLNNMLTIIQGNAELLKLNLNQNEELNEILITCNNCLNILNELRNVHLQK